MRSHFEFVSPAFPASPDEEVETNPWRSGKALAKFLAGHLGAKGLHATEPAGEDWGWFLSFPNDNFRLGLGIGARDEVRDGWLVFTEPRSPFVRQLFRRIETRSAIEALISCAYAAVECHPDTSELRWWDTSDLKLAGM